VIRNGLRWRDAPAAYGPHKTIYNRFIRWSRLGVFNRRRYARGWGRERAAATSDAFVPLSFAPGEAYQFD